MAKIGILNKHGIMLNRGKHSRPIKKKNERNNSQVGKRHIKNVFEEGELKPDSTVAFFATVQTEGNRNVERKVHFFNLDKSAQNTFFRP